MQQMLKIMLSQAYLIVVIIKLYNLVIIIHHWLLYQMLLLSQDKVLVLFYCCLNADKFGNWWLTSVKESESSWMVLSRNRTDNKK